MKISPDIEKILKKYFDSFEKKRGIIKKAKRIGRLWITGELNVEGVDNFFENNSKKPHGVNFNKGVTQIITDINEVLSDKIEVIEMSICSIGGEVSAGITIFDYLRKTNLPIITVAYGEVCSMAADLFQIGAIRRMTVGSTLMLHHVQGGVDGTGEKMMAEAEITLYYNELSFYLSALRSGIPLSKLKKISRPLKYFGPEEAVKINLADEII